MIGTKKCPWCAEEILVDAKKCKHCGEFLDGLPEAANSNPSPAPSSPSSLSSSAEPVWRFGGFIWRCIAHDKAACSACRKAIDPPARSGRKDELYPSRPYSGKKNERQMLSKVGNTTSGTLACPKCGGTQFTAKRSAKGKVIGFTTLGVGGLIAPKSQVKCVTCGTMFKRG